MGHWASVSGTRERDRNRLRRCIALDPGVRHVASDGAESEDRE